MLSTLAFLALMAIAFGLAGAIGSLVLGIAAAAVGSLVRSLGHTTALIAITLVNGFLAVAWSAFVMLWVERGSPPWNPPQWAAFVGGLMLIVAPVGMAEQSAKRAVLSGQSNNRSYDLFRSIRYVDFIVFAAIIVMYFYRSALHWWGWLPFSS